MKKIYVSSIAAAMLTTGAFAQSNTVKDAFANGTTSGSVSIFSKNINKNGSNKDSGYSMTSIALDYETDTFNGFKARLGVRSNHMINEKEINDYSDGTDPEAAFGTANISYTYGDASIIVGRQELDLEWVSDYHEAVVGVFNNIPDTTIVLAHTERFMAVDDDAALEEMADIGTNGDGANVIDVKYEGIENTVINPYFMDAKDTFSAYGLKATTTVSNIDLTAHYAASNEDVAGTEDGSIAHFEIGTKISDIGFKAGYITTDKEGGVASLETLGENIAPTKATDDSVYAADSDSYYGRISGEIASVSLSALYTVSKHGNDKDSELLIKAGTEIAENLEIDFLYSGASYENSNDDKDRITLMATYSF